MDAPPPKEDCGPFVDIAGRLTAAGLNVPKVFEMELKQGFLLLSDLGPTTYYDKIVAGVEDFTLQKMYREALAALVDMQATRYDGLPRYDAPRLKEELGLFTEWYTSIHCKTILPPETLQALDTVFDLLVKHNAAQPQVFVHRDFHSPNLMLCEEEKFGANPGILDFQDAVAGPITYDLASLVMDARTRTLQTFIATTSGWAYNAICGFWGSSLALITATAKPAISRTCRASISM